MYDNNNIPRSVICPDCKKEVKVTSFGYGYMAVCYDCHKVVYDDRKLSTAAYEK